MIETLNKYGLLFDSIPRGYSNVEMKSVSFSFVTNVVKIYRKLLIYGEVMFCWRKGGKVTILLKYLSPYLIFSLSSNYLEADGMRNGGKGVIVHILFSVCLFIFCCLVIFPFLPSSIRRLNEKRRYRALVFK